MKTIISRTRKKPVYSCDSCHKLFNQKNVCISHETSCIDKPVKRKNSMLLFKCQYPECEESFQYYYQSKKHYSTVHGPKRKSDFNNAIVSWLSRKD